MIKRNFLAAAAATLMVGTAFASPVVLPEGSLGTVGTAPSLFAGVHATGAASTSFTDNFYFSLSGTSDLIGSLGTLLGNVSFTSVTLNSSAITLSPTQSFSLTGLAAGSYTLSVAGTVTTGINGYSGAVYATPAVPEPGSIALVLAGAGIVGAVARRRRAA